MNSNFSESLSGTLSLEVTNTPGMVKVEGSNLTRTCFFFQTGNIPFQKKNCWPIIFFVCLVGAFYIFLLYAVFIVVAFNVFIYCCNL